MKWNRGTGFVPESALLDRRLLAVLAVGALALAHACTDASGRHDRTGPHPTTPRDDAGTSQADTGPSCPGTDPGLMSACSQFCDAVYGSTCALADPTVPYVYQLYVSPNYDSVEQCASRCMTGYWVDGDTFPMAAEQCGPSVRALIECYAETGVCDPSQLTGNEGNGRAGHWVTSQCTSQEQALEACGNQCLDLPMCDPSTCSGSASAGGVFCFWHCEGRICERECN